MNAILPVARRMLRQYGELYPYGGYMKPDCTIVMLGAEDPETDRPKSKDLIDLLRSALQETARARTCKATALVFDIAVALPNSDRRSDAIQVCLEHEDGYCVEVFFPYQLVEGHVIQADSFAQLGTPGIFERH